MGVRACLRVQEDGTTDAHLPDHSEGTAVAFLRTAPDTLTKIGSYKGMFRGGLPDGHGVFTYCGAEYKTFAGLWHDGLAKGMGEHRACRSQLFTVQLRHQPPRKCGLFDGSGRIQPDKTSYVLTLAM